MFDPANTTASLFPNELCTRYSFTSFNGAAAILRYNLPHEFERLVALLTTYRTRLIDICRPGGNRSPTTMLFGKLADRCGYRSEVTLQSEYIWAVTAANESILEWRTGNELHAHKIDHWSDRVSLDFEWNSKDQTYDRDLLAIRQFFDLGIISVGVIVTRDLSSDFTKFFPSLEIFDTTKTYSSSQLRTRIQKRGLDLVQIERKGQLQTLHTKMGASTTGLPKLRSRLSSGRGGACPVLVVGISDRNVIR